MNKAVLCLIIILFSSVFVTNANDNKSKAAALCNKGIEFINKGAYDTALVLLDEALKIEPDNLIYNYEKGLALYQLKEYTKTIQILLTLTKNPKVTDLVFQLLGNSYDMLDSSEKAVSAYKSGLEIFPNSGRLYMELGLVEQKFQKKMRDVVDYWEKGIELAPDFIYNYYYCSLYYCKSVEKIWGLLYGELFLNISDNQKRNSEISKIIFETFKNSFVIKEPGERVKFGFSKIVAGNVPDTSQNRFETAFQSVMQAISEKHKKDQNEFNIQSLVNIRNEFLEQWFELGLNSKFPNVLIDWLKELKDKNYLEAYTYFIFRDAGKEEFKKWVSENKKTLSEFARWAETNRLSMNENKKMHRRQYE